MKTCLLTCAVILAAFALAACGGSQPDGDDGQWDRLVVAAAKCWEESYYGGTGMSDTTVTLEYAHQVMEKYLDLILRQPNFVLTGATDFNDDEENWTAAVHIKIGVTEKVDQSSLPEADRIPDCLDGVPVRFSIQNKIQLLNGG